MPATVISVANNKGGIGKTLISVNLCDALGRMGKRVAFIDMDTQCNGTDFLMPDDNRRIENSLEDILDPGQELDSVYDVFYPSSAKGVTVIPNIEETALLEREIILESAKGFPIYSRLREFIQKNLTPHYDYVILDNPPNLGTYVLISLAASDVVIVPVMATSSKSVGGLVKMIRMIKEMQKLDYEEGGNPNLRFLRLLINGADRRRQLTKNTIANIREAFGADVFNTEIPTNVAFEVADSKNQTIFQCDGSSPGARSFRNLAKELVEIIDSELNKDEPSLFDETVVTE